jgi:hypothetical protein
MKPKTTASGGPTTKAAQSTPKADATDGPRSEKEVRATSVVSEIDLCKTSGLSPPTKICSACNIEKIESEFYKKGNRRDSQCIECCLKKKKGQRLRAKSKKERRSKTKVLDLSNYEVQEKHLAKTTYPQDHFNDLLRSYVLDLVLGLFKEIQNGQSKTE